DDHTARLKLAHHRVGDLARQPFLDLRTLRVQIDETREFGQAGDASGGAGDVPDVCDAVERHQMVLTGRVHRDVPDQDQFLVSLVEGRVEDLVGVGEQSREHLAVGAGD